LLEYPGIDANIKSGTQEVILNLAVTKGNSFIVQLLLKHKTTQLNVKDGKNEDSLEVAVGQYYYEEENEANAANIALLLKYGAFLGYNGDEEVRKCLETILAIEVMP
jgi:hypothetical protein